MGVSTEMKFREPQPEKIAERNSAKQLEEVGVEVLKVKVDGQRGWPDRWVVGPDRLLFMLEFKREGEESYPLQVHRHKRLRELGFEVYECFTVEDALNAYKIEIEKSAKSQVKKVPGKGGVVPR